MAIIINGKRYSSPSELQEVFVQLKRVPQPTVSLKDEAKITDEEVVLCLQRESVYTQKKALKNTWVQKTYNHASWFIFIVMMIFLLSTVMR